MARPKKLRSSPETLPTIWEVPDDLWGRFTPILAELDPPKPRGRPRIDARAALNAILFRLRSGCQWNQLPKTFPDDSSVHRTFQRWITVGVFARLWAVLMASAPECGGVDWEWQAADGAMGKARLGGSHRTQPHGPGQKRREAQSIGGGDGWPAGSCGRGGQRA